MCIPLLGFWNCRKLKQIKKIKLLQNGHVILHVLTHPNPWGAPRLPPWIPMLCFSRSLWGRGLSDWSVEYIKTKVIHKHLLCKYLSLGTYVFMIKFKDIYKLILTQLIKLLKLIGQISWPGPNPDPSTYMCELQRLFIILRNYEMKYIKRSLFNKYCFISSIQISAKHQTHNYMLKKLNYIY